jgi:hypothetical protein
VSANSHSQPPPPQHPHRKSPASEDQPKSREQKARERGRRDRKIRSDARAREAFRSYVGAQPGQSPSQSINTTQLTFAPLYGGPDRPSQSPSTGKRISRTGPIKTGPGDTAVANPERGPIPQPPSPGNGNVLAQSPARSPSTQPPSQYGTAQSPTSLQLGQPPWIGSPGDYRYDPEGVDWREWFKHDISVASANVGPYRDRCRIAGQNV